MRALSIRAQGKALHPTVMTDSLRAYQAQGDYFPEKNLRGHLLNMILMSSPCVKKDAFEHC